MTKPPGLRILHVLSHLAAEAGGPARAIVGLARAQARQGHKVRVVATWHGQVDESIQAELEAGQVGVRQVGPAWGPLRMHQELGPALEGEIEHTDVVHIHALWEDIQHRAARIAHRRRVPYIVRPCGMLDPWSLAQSAWKKKLMLALRVRANLDRAAALHYTCAVERDLAAPLAIKAPAVVEPNGVELGEFARLPELGEFRQRWPQLHDRPFALFLSRVHPKKGLDLLVPAFARLPLGDSMLVIAGPDGDGHGDEIRQLAASLGVGNRVVFTGLLKGRERLAAFVDAELFVLTSRQENFGVSVVEALAASTPVLISDQVNIHREITEAGVGGVVPLDVATIARELERWLVDAELRSAAKERAASFVRTHYDWDRIAERWTTRYRDLVAHR